MTHCTATKFSFEPGPGSFQLHFDIHFVGNGLQAVCEVLKFVVFRYFGFNSGVK